LKKIIIVIIVLILIVVWYLKMSFYSSEIEDNYFENNFIKKNIHWNNNWFIIYWKFLQYVMDNNDIEWKIQKEIDIYSDIRHKDFLIYSENLWFNISDSIIYEIEKIDYAKRINNNKSFLIIINSLINNIYLFNNIEWNIDTNKIILSTIHYDLQFLKHFKKTKKQNNILLEILKKHQISKKRFHHSIKNSYWSIINKINNWFWYDDYYKTQIIVWVNKNKKDITFDYIKWKMIFLLFYNWNDTKEIIKSIFKEKYEWWKKINLKEIYYLYNKNSIWKEILKDLINDNSEEYYKTIIEKIKDIIN